MPRNSRKAMSAITVGQNPRPGRLPLLSRLCLSWLALSLGLRAATTFYVDSDWTGMPNGTASQPWKSLSSDAWSGINSALATGDVTVYFSAREASSDTDDLYDIDGDRVQDIIDLNFRTDAGSGVLITTNSVNNPVLSNSIYANTRLGITLISGGNDDNVVNDSSAQLSATSDGTSSTTVQGTGMGADPNATFRLEFFANQQCDPSGFGEGQTFIGTVTVMSDAQGNVVVNQTFPVGIPTGQFVTFNFTPASGDTSQFSRCIQVNASVNITGHVVATNGFPIPNATVKLTGTQNATYDHFRRTVQLLPQLTDLRRLITHTFPLADAPKAFDVRLNLEGLKAEVVPG